GYSGYTNGYSNNALVRAYSKIYPNGQPYTPTYSPTYPAPNVYQAAMPTDLGLYRPQSTNPISAAPAVMLDAANTIRNNFHGSGLFTKGWFS
ncbi:hypothetical protein ABTE38_19155, partial [Acinetobacter baumannii]